MQLPNPKNYHYLNRYKSLLLQYSDNSGYTEIHHVCPKSLGGSDDPDNLIAIPSRIHFLAHWMLWKAYDTDELSYAFWAMCHQKKKGQEHRYTKINSKTYAILKERRSAIISQSNSDRWKDPVWAAKMKQTLKAAASTPKEKIRRSIQATLSNTKRKKQISEQMLKLWADPIWAENFKQKSKNAHAHRIKKILVNGIEYKKVKDVSDKYEISIATVRQRIKSKTTQFSGWQYIDPGL